jgi:signal transduction histidine kinase
MRYLSERLSWTLFAIGVVVLIVLGIATDLVTRKLVTSEKWIAHTHQVNSALTRLHNDILRADSGRLRYIFANDQERLQQTRRAASQIPEDLAEVKRLTSDNPQQQAALTKLDPALQQRVALLEESLKLRESGAPDKERQAAITTEAGELMQQVAATITEMRGHEEALLSQRQIISENVYTEARVVIIGAFAIAIVLLTLSFRQLVVELRDRRLAQQAVRRLSARVLELQDVERRKIARELHDSIGQYFAGMAMMLDTIRHQEMSAERRDLLLAESVKMAQQGASETRTLSHLLHPPLLDEKGFASAAKWYVDGYKDRSKIDVKIEFDGEEEELSREIALALFRALQEGLTNIHRHSGSRSAHVVVKTTPSHVAMTVADQGKGIPEIVLEQFRLSRSAGGIGLAGLRERIAELGGTLELESGNLGTTLKVELPAGGKVIPSEPQLGPKRNGEQSKQAFKSDGPLPGPLTLLNSET